MPNLSVFLLIAISCHAVIAAPYSQNSPSPKQKRAHPDNGDENSESFSEIVETLNTKILELISEFSAGFTSATVRTEAEIFVVEIGPFFEKLDVQMVLGTLSESDKKSYATLQENNEHLQILMSQVGELADEAKNVLETEHTIEIDTENLNFHDLVGVIDQELFQFLESIQNVPASDIAAFSKELGESLEEVMVVLEEAAVSGEIDALDKIQFQEMSAKLKKIKSLEHLSPETAVKAVSELEKSSSSNRPEVNFDIFKNRSVKDLNNELNQKITKFIKTLVNVPPGDVATKTKEFVDEIYAIFKYLQTQVNGGNISETDKKSCDKSAEKLGFISVLIELPPSAIPSFLKELRIKLKHIDNPRLYPDTTKNLKFFELAYRVNDRIQEFVDNLQNFLAKDINDRTEDFYKEIEESLKGLEREMGSGKIGEMEKEFYDKITAKLNLIKLLNSLSPAAAVQYVIELRGKFNHIDDPSIHPDTSTNPKFYEIVADFDLQLFKFLESLKNGNFQDLKVTTRTFEIIINLIGKMIDAGEVDDAGKEIYQKMLAKLEIMKTLSNLSPEAAAKFALDLVIKFKHIDNPDIYPDTTNNPEFYESINEINKMIFIFLKGLQTVSYSDIQDKTKQFMVDIELIVKKLQLQVDQDGFDKTAFTKVLTKLNDIKQLLDVAPEKAQNQVLTLLLKFKHIDNPTLYPDPSENPKFYELGTNINEKLWIFLDGLEKILSQEIGNTTTEFMTDIKIIDEEIRKEVDAGKLDESETEFYQKLLEKFQSIDSLKDYTPEEALKLVSQLKLTFGAIDEREVVVDFGKSANEIDEKLSKFLESMKNVPAKDIKSKALEFNKEIAATIELLKREVKDEKATNAEKELLDRIILKFDNLQQLTTLLPNVAVNPVIELKKIFDCIDGRKQAPKIPTFQELATEIIDKLNKFADDIRKVKPQDIGRKTQEFINNIEEIRKKLTDKVNYEYVSTDEKNLFDKIVQKIDKITSLTDKSPVIVANLQNLFDAIDNTEQPKISTFQDVAKDITEKLNLFADDICKVKPQDIGGQTQEFINNIEEIRKKLTDKVNRGAVNKDEKDLFGKIVQKIDKITSLTDKSPYVVAKIVANLNDIFRGIDNPEQQKIPTFQDLAKDITDKLNKFADDIPKVKPQDTVGKSQEFINNIDENRKKLTDVVNSGAASNDEIDLFRKIVQKIDKITSLTHTSPDAVAKIVANLKDIFLGIDNPDQPTIPTFQDLAKDITDKLNQFADDIRKVKLQDVGGKPQEFLNSIEGIRKKLTDMVNSGAASKDEKDLFNKIVAKIEKITYMIDKSPGIEGWMAVNLQHYFFAIDNADLELEQPKFPTFQNLAKDITDKLNKFADDIRKVKPQDIGSNAQEFINNIEEIRKILTDKVNSGDVSKDEKHLFDKIVQKIDKITSLTDKPPDVVAKIIANLKDIFDGIDNPEQTKIPTFQDLAKEITEKLNNFADDIKNAQPQDVRAKTLEFLKQIEEKLNKLRDDVNSGRVNQKENEMFDNIIKKIGNLTPLTTVSPTIASIIINDLKNIFHEIDSPEQEAEQPDNPVFQNLAKELKEKLKKFIDDITKARPQEVKTKALAFIKEIDEARKKLTNEVNNGKVNKGEMEIFEYINNIIGNVTPLITVSPNVATLIINDLKNMLGGIDKPEQDPGATGNQIFQDAVKQMNEKLSKFADDIKTVQPQDILHKTLEFKQAIEELLKKLQHEVISGRINQEEKDLYEKINSKLEAITPLTNLSPTMAAIIASHLKIYYDHIDKPTEQPDSPIFQNLAREINEKLDKFVEGIQLVRPGDIGSKSLAFIKEIEEIQTKLIDEVNNGRVNAGEKKVFNKILAKIENIRPLSNLTPTIASLIVGELKNIFNTIDKPDQEQDNPIFKDLAQQITDKLNKFVDEIRKVPSEDIRNKTLGFMKDIEDAGYSLTKEVNNGKINEQEEDLYCQIVDKIGTIIPLTSRSPESASLLVDDLRNIFDRIDKQNKEPKFGDLVKEIAEKLDKFVDDAPQVSPGKIDEKLSDLLNGIKDATIKLEDQINNGKVSEPEKDLYKKLILKIKHIKSLVGQTPEAVVKSVGKLKDVFKEIDTTGGVKPETPTFEQLAKETNEKIAKFIDGVQNVAPKEIGKKAAEFLNGIADAVSRLEEEIESGEASVDQKKLFHIISLNIKHIKSLTDQSTNAALGTGKNIAFEKLTKEINDGIAKFTKDVQTVSPEEISGKTTEFVKAIDDAMMKLEEEVKSGRLSDAEKDLHKKIILKIKHIKSLIGQHADLAGKAVKDLNQKWKGIDEGIFDLNIGKNLASEELTKEINEGIAKFTKDVQTVSPQEISAKTTEYFKTIDDTIMKLEEEIKSGRLSDAEKDLHKKMIVKIKRIKSLIGQYADLSGKAVKDLNQKWKGIDEGIFDLNIGKNLAFEELTKEINEGIAKFTKDVQTVSPQEISAKTTDFVKAIDDAMMKLEEEVKSGRLSDAEKDLHKKIILKIKHIKSLIGQPADLAGKAVKDLNQKWKGIDEGIFDLNTGKNLVFEKFSKDINDGIDKFTEEVQTVPPQEIGNKIAEFVKTVEGAVLKLDDEIKSGRLTEEEKNHYRKIILKIKYIQSLIGQPVDLAGKSIKELVSKWKAIDDGIIDPNTGKNLIFEKFANQINEGIAKFADDVQKVAPGDIPVKTTEFAKSIDDALSKLENEIKSGKVSEAQMKIYKKITIKIKYIKSLIGQTQYEAVKTLGDLHLTLKQIDEGTYKPISNEKFDNGLDKLITLMIPLFRTKPKDISTVATKFLADNDGDIKELQLEVDSGNISVEQKARYDVFLEYIDILKKFIGLGPEATAKHLNASSDKIRKLSRLYSKSTATKSIKFDELARDLNARIGKFVEGLVRMSPKDRTRKTTEFLDSIKDIVAEMQLEVDNDKVSEPQKTVARIIFEKLPLLQQIIGLGPEASAKHAGYLRLEFDRWDTGNLKRLLNPEARSAKFDAVAEEVDANIQTFWGTLQNMRSKDIRDQTKAFLITIDKQVKELEKEVTLGVIDDDQGDSYEFIMQKVAYFKKLITLTPNEAAKSIAELSIGNTDATQPRGILHSLRDFLHNARTDISSRH